MTVGEIREMMEGLPDEMRCIIPVGQDVFLAVCRGKSGVMAVEQPDADPDEMLVLVPCNCEADGLPIIVDVNPN